MSRRQSPRFERKKNETKAPDSSTFGELKTKIKTGHGSNQINRTRFDFLDMFWEKNSSNQCQRLRAVHHFIWETSLTGSRATQRFAVENWNEMSDHVPRSTRLSLVLTMHKHPPTMNGERKKNTNKSHTEYTEAKAIFSIFSCHSDR